MIIRRAPSDNASPSNGVVSGKPKLRVLRNQTGNEYMTPAETGLGSISSLGF